jgi:hypothetical protein
MGVAAILPDSLDERQVLVGLVATAANRPFHEHTVQVTRRERKYLPRPHLPGTTRKSRQRPVREPI